MKIMRVWTCLVVLMSGMPVMAATPPASEVTSRQNGLESLLISRSGGSTILKIGLREGLAATPSNFSIANPARLIFDLPGTDNALGFTSKVVNDGALRSLNVVQAGDRSRLVLNLDKMMRFETRQEGKFLLITLLDGDTTPVDGRSAAVQSFAGSDKAELSIRDIQFRRGKDGAGVVAIDLSASDGGVDIVQKGSTLLVSFKKTKLPDHLRRQMDVVDFATPINTVKTRSSGDDVTMEIVPKGLWEHMAFQTDNQFIVEVRPLKEDPGKLFQGSKTGYQGEAISLNFQNIPLRELLHVFADITNFNIVVSDSVVGNVSLRLNDVAWDHALEIVLQQKNLAMRKSGNVLWIAPRDELAARDKTEAEARDAAVMAEIPRVEPFQLNYQKAEEFAAMLSPTDKAADPGAKSGGNQQGGFISSIGKVTIDKRTNQVFVYDVPSKHDLIRDLLSKVDRPARQVLIEARIIEANTGFTKALGARLGGHDHYGMNNGYRILGTNTRFGVSASTQDAYTHLPENREYVNRYMQIPGNAVPLPAGSTPVYWPVGNKTMDSATAMQPLAYSPENLLPGSDVGTINQSQFSNVPAAGALGQFALTLFNSTKTQLLTMEVSASETDSRSKTIASPRVLTADQVEATIKQGDRVPYLTATSSGATAISWADAALALKVTPQITPDGRVLMKIKINKDEVGDRVTTMQVPMIKTKEIVSEVHIDNGGTIVIGGVFTSSEKNNQTRVPFFGDLPYIGFLFKMNQKEESRTELIIMLTPKIVDNALGVKL